ncbi:MAG: hypothetical protein A2X46_05315 [Lentisphaerae bacterium GWF2_57_35]|nr:MAG: hypothetical protein A2X46_05315 [Lentisphaerae bacterium GWF2_57_35]
MMAIFLLSGCGTMPAKYIPVTLGPVIESESVQGIELTILPSVETIAIGEVLTMTVTIKNIHTEPVWFPRNPEIMMLWIYPDGKRDNLVFECTENRFYTEDQVVWLKAGQVVQTKMRIKTYYFPKPGVTEFQAFCNAASNTNPAIRPFWHGKIFSNTYGVMVEKNRRSSS